MITALYFRTYYSYLLGDLEKTRMFYGILREEFKARKNIDALDRYQLTELKKIRAALDSGTVTTKAWINDGIVSDVRSTDEIIKQTVLVKKIHHEAFDSLKKCLSSDDSLYLYNIEHPCGRYGRVDMVYKDTDVIYPTEIKPSEGQHDILGQIRKYELHFSILLNLRHFKRVQPVTICNSYNKHTLVELKRMSVMTLKYSLINDRVTIGAV
jgi:hypothetical protein